MAGSNQSSKQQQQHGPAAKQDTEADGPFKRPGRNIALLMSAYWLSWLITVASDVLIAIRRQFFPGELFIKSPIVRYIYTKHIYQWPYGGYYVLDPFFIKWGPAIDTSFFISSTVCTILQLMLVGHLRPFKNNVSDALVMLWVAICLLSASLLGLTKHESSIVALPFGWLTARTLQLYCLRKRMYPVEVSVMRGRIVFLGSLALFLAVHVGVLAVTSDMIMIVLLFEAGLIVWRWLRETFKDEQDVEKA